MAYLDAMDVPSRERLKLYFADKLIKLSEQDAENFIANSFQVDTPTGPHLVMPEKASMQIKAKVRALGIPFSTIDVSEFFEKGGGSIKCMLCDLGMMEATD